MLTAKKQCFNGADNTSSPDEFSVRNSEAASTRLGRGIKEVGAVCCTVTIHFLVFWWLCVPRRVCVLV
jgi:predicted deacetylase